MKRVLLACVLAAAGTIATLAACKSGAGERCQISDDCASGLICNKAKNTCQSGESSGEDDADILVPDASTIDAMTDAASDAASDAPTDAMIDSLI